MRGVITAASRMEPSASLPLQVLLAEDDAASRQVILHLVQPLGYHVEIATTGPAALAKLWKQPFNVALIEVQLPGVNGLDITKQLRTYEQTHGGHLPVIALTVRPSADDKARCLAEGMDAYLGKPIEAAALYAILREMLGAAPPVRRPSAALDVAMILQTIGGNRTLLRQLGQLFLAHVPRQLVTLQGAVAQGNPAALERAAHTMRSSMATFHAMEACRLLEALLVMGRAQQLPGDSARAVVRALQAEIERIMAFLCTPGWDTLEC